MRHKNLIIIIRNLNRALISMTFKDLFFMKLFYLWEERNKGRQREEERKGGAILTNM